MNYNVSYSDPFTLNKKSGFTQFIVCEARPFVAKILNPSKTAKIIELDLFLQ